MQEKGVAKLCSSPDVKQPTAAGDVIVSVVPRLADSIGRKYQVHLNVSSSNGCFLNFGTNFGFGSAFPFPDV